MATTKRMTPTQARLLARVATSLAKAKEAKVFETLHPAFSILAAAGHVAAAKSVATWLYGGRVAMPKTAPFALTTETVDGFAFAADLGDITQGKLADIPAGAPVLPLEQRVRATENRLRRLLLSDAYSTVARREWRKLKESDNWRRIDQWREVQVLANSSQTERKALELLAEYLETWEHDDSGAGFGQELLLAMDLELRLNRGARVASWIQRHGHRCDALLDQALCLPVVATAICHGLLRNVMGVGDAEANAAVKAMDRVLGAPPRPTPKMTIPAVQRRRVTCEYGQVHLEPEELSRAESKQVYFRRKDEPESGMSVFPTRVAVGTPPDTSHVDAAITVDPAPKGELDLTGVVQAVAFPIDVRGPIVLRNVASDGNEDPIAIAPGKYDVLATFRAKGRSKRTLRVFELSLSFRPAGSLGAPKTYRMSD